MGGVQEESTLTKYAKPKYIAIIIFALIAVRLVDVYTEKQPLLVRVVIEAVRAFFGVGRHSLAILTLALLIFIFTINKKPFYDSTVNAIAKNAFGVYLFHENKLLNVCDLFMKHLVDVKFLAANAAFPLTYLCGVLMLFCFGIVVESIQFRLIHVPLMKWIDGRFSQQIASAENWINSVFE